MGDSARITIASTSRDNGPAARNDRSRDVAASRRRTQRVPVDSEETTLVTQLDELCGKKVVSELSSRWANNNSVIVFTWQGTDIVSGRQTSSTGILGWDTARQIVVEHEIGADGSIFHGTHHISKDGRWISPYKGSTVVDGKPVFFEAHRRIKFVSDDEWTVTGTHWTLSEDPRKGPNATFRRK